MLGHVRLSRGEALVHSALIWAETQVQAIPLPLAVIHLEEPAGDVGLIRDYLFEN